MAQPSQLGTNGARLSGRSSLQAPVSTLGAHSRRQALRPCVALCRAHASSPVSRAAPVPRASSLSRATLSSSSSSGSRQLRGLLPTPALAPGRSRRLQQRVVCAQSSLDDDKPERLDLEKKDPSFAGLAAWVGGAIAFGFGIWYFMGQEKAEEYFAGYLLEQSLSVDNLFVFLLVFGYFKTPEGAQGKVLQYGIFTAAVLRAIFILGGVELIQEFEPALAVFAAILIASSVKLITQGDDDDSDEDLSNNAVVQLCRRFIKTGDQYDGDRFFTMLADGTKVATPLLLALAVIELSDVVFAVDSIPAVFGVTLDPFIIYTSNMFAIFSLRALYGFVSTVMTELRFLDKAVALVLGFIGTKMLLGFVDVHVPTDVSLLVVGLVLGGGVGASLLLPEPADTD